MLKNRPMGNNRQLDKKFVVKYGSKKSKQFRTATCLEASQIEQKVIMPLSDNCC